MKRFQVIFQITALVMFVGLHPMANAEQPSNGQCVLGWIPFWDQERAVASFKNNIDLFAHISVFWYHLDWKSNLKKYRHAVEDRQLIELAHREGIKVLAIVANLPDDDEAWDHDHPHVFEEQVHDDWDRVRVSQVIHSASRRRQHIDDLVSLAKRMNFDGINIDYESLAPKDRDDFSRFVKELGSALHAEGKILAVALHPKTSEYNSSENNGSRAQDWTAIHPFVDQLHLMTYGEHWSGSQPGPIASPAWISGVLRYAVTDKELPVDKIFLGIPLYAVRWQSAPSDSFSDNHFEGVDVELTFSDIQETLTKHGTGRIWDEDSKSPFLRYEENGTKHVVWYEDADSISHKLKLGQNFGISNIALWRLGGEDPRIWKAIRHDLVENCGTT